MLCGEIDLTRIRACVSNHAHLPKGLVLCKFLASCVQVVLFVATFCDAPETGVMFLFEEEMYGILVCVEA